MGIVHDQPSAGLLFGARWVAQTDLRHVQDGELVSTITSPTRIHTYPAVAPTTFPLAKPPTLVTGLGFYVEIFGVFASQIHRSNNDDRIKWLGQVRVVDFITEYFEMHGGR